MYKPTQTSSWNSSQFMTNRSYEINYYRDKDFKAVSLHSHDFYELYFFVNGDASYIIENGHYKMQSGDILLISPQNLHQLDINDSNETYERIVLWLNPKYVKRLSSSKTNLATCFTVCDKRKDFLIRDFLLSQNVNNLLTELYTRNDAKDFGNDIECENIIRQILLALCKYEQTVENNPVDSMKRQRTNPTVATVIEYIDSHLSENLSLDILAEKIYMSKFYLSRLFKEETSSTIHQYVLKKRLTLSKHFIEKDLPITEVCTKCGFQDYSHFFRAFKTEFGITPKQYYSLMSHPVI